FETVPLPHAPGPALRNSPLRGSDSPRLFPVRARGSRRSKGFERLSPSPAFELQLSLKEFILDVSLKFGSRLGVLASGTVCGLGWPQPSPQGWVHGVFRKPRPRGGLH